MTTPGGQEPPDPDPDETAPERSPRWRDEIAKADPQPVTDAMVTPRTAAFVGSPDGPNCHVCGASNHTGASYCLNCGVQLHSRPTSSLRAEIEAARAGNPPPPRSEHPGSEHPGSEHRGSDGMDFVDADELADAAFHRQRAPEPGPAVPDDAEDRDVQRTLRTAFAALMIVAALALFVITFGGDSNQVPDASSTTTATEPVDLVERYSTLLSGLSDRVAQLVDQAGIANDTWESGTAEFDATLSELQSIAGSTRPLEQTVRDVELPAAADPALHARLTTAAATLASAADAMVSGLQASDTGEARRAALARYEAAGAEFQAVVGSINQILAESSG